MKQIIGSLKKTIKHLARLKKMREDTNQQYQKMKWNITTGPAATKRKRVCYK